MPAMTPRGGQVRFGRALLGGALLLALLALPLGQIATAAQGSGTASAPAPTWRPYLADNQTRRWLPLNPTTLAVVPNGQPLTFRGDPWTVLISADGTTVAMSAGDDAIRVRAADGTERVTLHAPEAVFPVALSRDGSRLLASTPGTCGVVGCSRETWYDCDTRAGRLLTTVHSAAGDDGPLLVDAGLTRLYRTFRAGAPNTGPAPFGLVAYDLDSGRELARRTYPDISVQLDWRMDENQVPVSQVLSPGVALSPDGGRLAIVHADADRLTVVDARSLAVVGSHALAPRQGWGGRLLGWLGLLPTAAEAKEQYGRQLSAAFMPDGRRLLVWGSDTRPGAKPNTVDERGLGLRLVEAGTGTILASAAAGGEFSDVLPTPDGRAIYAAGWPSASSTRLFRFDGGTLETLAVRDLPEDGSLRLFPAGLVGDSV